MDGSSGLLQAGHEILVRAAADPATATRPPVYKAIGISLAISSGVFIGVSFVLKKVGLLRANVKYNEEAGEGYGYLKNAYWWAGMTLMILGEICNFVAYAFVDAILVTPLGALSVVITTILSAIFLKERLSFVGKTGCFICIIGSIVIVLNAPAQSSAGDIQDMQNFVIAPGFLSYAGVVIVGCAFMAFWAGPRYGKKSMLVYLTICSLIGGLSVVATQGLGAAVVAQAGGKPQFNQWFLYVLLVFVVCTLVTEIIFLNVSSAILLYGQRWIPPNAGGNIESPQHLQRRFSHAYILRLLHERNNRQLSDLVPRLQRHSPEHCNHHHGIFTNLRRCRSLTALEICKGRARCCSVLRRSRPSSDRG